MFTGIQKHHSSQTATAVANTHVISCVGLCGVCGGEAQWCVCGGVTSLRGVWGGDAANLDDAGDIDDAGKMDDGGKLDEFEPAALHASRANINR